MSGTLAARIAQPDLAGLPEWKVAEILNAPDDSLPKVRRSVNKRDAQEILLASGEWAQVYMVAENTAAPAQLRGACINLRDTIRLTETIAMDNPAIYAAVDAVLSGLVAAQFLTAQTRGALLALADQPQSWAEANNIEVTARSVGLARGGI
jgi:hypothetical protein